MLTRSFGANGQFQIADWTEELNVIPNTYTTIQDFGIFSDEPVASSAVTFEEIINTIKKIFFISV